MPRSYADNAIEILQRTRDGEDLDPAHLKRVELAVNGFLHEQGRLAFDTLLAQARAGYVKPWFRGAQHMTRNHEGHVLWKGNAVGHFSGAYAHSDEAKTYLAQLGRRCAAIEAQGAVPDTLSVVWRWPDDAD